MGLPNLPLPSNLLPQLEQLGVIPPLQQEKKQQAKTSSEKISGTTKKTSFVRRGLVKLESDPRFQSKTPEQKLEIRKQVYYKYVEDLYKSKGLDAPGAEAWASKSFYPKADLGSGQVFGMSGAKALATAGKNISHYGGVYTDPFGFNEKIFKVVEDKINNWRADHYSDVARHKTADIIGEGAGQLPLWMAVGEGMAAMGLAAKATPLVTNLTKLPLGKILTSSKTGQFVGRRLFQAAEGYLGSRLSGQDSKESIGSGAGFATLGAAGEGVGAGYKVGKNLLTSAFNESGAKLYLKELLSNGGWRFATDVLRMSRKDLEELHASDEAKKAIQEKYGSLPGRVRDSLLDKINDANKELINGLSKKYYGKNYQFLNSDQRQEVITQLEKGMLPAAVKEVAYDKKTVAKEVVEGLKKESPQFQKASQTLGVDPKELVKNVAISNVRAAKQASGVHNKEIRAILEEINAVAQPSKAISSVGAAKKNSLEFLQGAINKFAGKSPIKLQGNTNKLLYAWMKASPKDKEIIAKHLENDAQLGKHTPKVWTEMANALKEHMTKMAKTGHISPEDERGVFFSSRFHPKSKLTEWQEQLDDELESIEKDIPKIKNKRAKEIASSVVKGLKGRK